MIYNSPIGDLVLCAQDGKLAAVHLPNGSQAPTNATQHAAVLDKTARALDAYFAGKQTTFELPLHFGGTPFQNAVWQALCRIPYGHTSSYGAVAKELNRPKAMRAVGVANSKNPIAIVVPCHRVIGVNGTLTGYAGGLETKAWLLQHERS